MAEVVNEAVIRVTADASGVDAGLRRVDESAARTGRNLENLGRQPGIRNVGEGVTTAATSVEAGLRRVDESTARTGRNMAELSRQPGLRNMGDGADTAATRIDRSTRNMADSIQRTTAAMQAGSRGTADYFRALASQRGLDANALRPYLQQLEEVTRQTEQAALAQRRLDEGTRFLADLRSRADGVGRTASQLAEMRAAQLGVSEAAGPMIARLRQAEQGTTGFAAVVLKAKAALAGFAAGAAFIAIAHEVVNAQREFDKLNASLETATGSSKRAGEAFKALQAFAATTPYDLKQTTEAFLELRNLGLTPSERALTSFGNTAAAKSKELKDVVAAVADAATGEFERLKEAFGITSQQIGDKVAFTFQGTTTLIQKDAKSIEEYLTRIGEVQFGGAMERQANTLNGAIGQLGDTWDSVMRSIASNGSGEAIRSVVMALGGALQDLGDIIDAVGGKASSEAGTIKESVGVHQLLTTAFKGIAITGVIATAAFKEAGQEIAALAAAGTLLVKGDLKGVKAVLEARRLDAESLSTWVGNKIRAITGVADAAGAAQDAETANAKKNSNDRLAQYAIELTADQKRVKAKQDIADIEKRVTGVDPQTASDLKKLKDALDAGAISQKEYAKLTAKVNEEALKGTTAYKDQIKQLDLSAVAIKNRADALAFLNSQEREHLDFLRRTSQMTEDDYISKSADNDVKALEDQKESLEAQRDLAKKKIDNKQQIKELDGQIDAVSRQIAARRTKEENDQFELEQRRYREAANNSADMLEAAQAESKAQQDRVRDGQDEIDMLGMTSKQIAEVAAQRLRDQAAMLDQRAAVQDLTDWTGRLGEESRKQAEALRAQAAQVGLKEELSRQKELWGQIEATAHDTFISIFDSGKSAFDRLRDTLKNGLLELLYQMTIKQWVFNIGASVGMIGPGAVAQAASVAGGAGAAAGAVSGAVGAAQMASNVYSTVTGGLTLAGGLGTGFMGSLAGGLSGAGVGSGLTSSLGLSIGNGILDVVGPGISSALASGMGAIATALPWVGGAVAVASLWKSAFGHGDTEVQGQGIRGTLSASGVSGQSYQKLHQDGGWFSSDRNWEKATGFTDAMSKQFTNGLQSMESAAASFASSLGVSADWVATYSKTFDLALTGDATKDQQVITDFFAGVGDEIANKLVPNLADFAKSGEAASATLERLAGDFKGTDQVAQLLGRSASVLFGATGIASAKARENLIGLAGGLSTLSSEASFFNQNFLTDAERIKPVAEALDKALDSLGLDTIPTTRDEFKGLINSLIDSGAAATDAGGKQLTSLLALAEAFAQVHPQIDATAEAVEKAADALQAMKDSASTLLGGVDSAFTALQKVVAREKAAVQASVTAQTAAVSKLQTLSQALRSTLDSLKSPDQKAAERASAQAQIRAALAIAKAGGALPTADSLKSALSVVTQDSADQFATYQDYLRDLYQTQNDISQLGDITDDQLSVAEKSLDALQDQLKSLDDQLEAAQEQIDILKGIDTNGLSLLDAMRGLTSAILQAQSNPIVGATSAINSAYQSALHRAPDAAGLEWWQNAAANGAPVSQIVDGIKGSTEATLNTLYRDVLGRAPDSEGLAFWMKAYGNTMDAAEQADWLKAAQKDPGYKIPGFASGGDFAGGLRWVGEIGPEMEATGAARIHSTRALIDALRSPSANADVLSAAVDRLQATVAQQQEVIERMASDMEKMADALSGASVNGGVLRVKVIN